MGFNSGFKGLKRH